MEIITNKNINLLKDELNCYDKAIIIGKGPTFQNVIRKEKELICAVNNSINFLDECDMLTINDIETVIKINQEKIKKLKYLIIPTYPHKNCKFNLQSTYHIILESFKINFNGKVLLYNLVTTPLKNKLQNIINLDTRISGSNNTFEYLLKFSNIRNFETYGIGILAQNNDYHQNFNMPLSKPLSNPLSKPLSNPLIKPLSKPLSKPISKPLTKLLFKPISNTLLKIYIFNRNIKRVNIPISITKLIII